MKILNVRIDEELRAQLERKASLEQRSKSELVRQALISCLEKSDEEYTNIPQEVVARIEFLSQITQYGEFNQTNWELVRKELKELCSVIRIQVV